MDGSSTQRLGEASSDENGGCFSFSNGIRQLYGLTTTTVTGAGGSTTAPYYQPTASARINNPWGQMNYRRRNNLEDAYILTEGFEKLSFTEREQALSELHGVSDSISENDAMIEQSLNDLQSEISKKYFKTFYDKALFLNPNYVENRDLRLMFLRGEKFDAGKAATKFIKHFEVKMELFGLECLARDITFDDLTEGAKEIYMTGSHWYTNIYDRSGRRIYLCSIANQIFKKPIDYLQMFWYSYMVAAEDVRTQRNGVISVVFAAGDTIRRPLDGGTFIHLRNVMSAIPVSVGGFHFCCEDLFISHIHLNPIKVVQWTMDTLTRTKLRVHHGTVLELKYALLSFGIPADTLPLDQDGKLIYGMFEQHVKERKRFESTNKERMAANNLVACPTKLDVLLGRGRPFQEFTGNLRLNRLVDTYRSAYDDMTKSEKTRTMTRIIELVHQSGGRFLRRLPATDSTKSTTNLTSRTESDFLENNLCDASPDTTLSVSATASSASSCNSYSVAAGWEVVDDITTVHRKVNNIFKTRRSRAPTSP